MTQKAGLSNEEMAQAILDACEAQSPRWLYYISVSNHHKGSRYRMDELKHTYYTWNDKITVGVIPMDANYSPDEEALNAIYADQDFE